MIASRTNALPFQDDELDDEDKSLLADESSHIEEESLLSTSSHSTKADAPLPPLADEKKIVLKRTVTTITAPTTSDATADAATDESSPKVAKLTQLTAAERLELRTKKFGAAAASLPVNTELKKQARAERFGIKSPETTTTPAAASEPTAAGEKKQPASNKIDTSTLEVVSVEVLKKRAERFGTVSSKLVVAENAERLAKRGDRFGITAPANSAEKEPASNGSPATDAAATTTSSAAATDYAERAKKRLDRFKQEVK